MFTFNAKELLICVDKLEQNTDEMQKNLNQIINICNWSESTYLSEDSNLARAYSHLSDALVKTKEQMKKAIDKLYETITDYERHTINIEERTESSINPISEELTSASDALSSIDSL